MRTGSSFVIIPQTFTKPNQQFKRKKDLISISIHAAIVCNLFQAWL